jgi:hypothetical protein
MRLTKDWIERSLENRETHMGMRNNEREKKAKCMVSYREKAGEKHMCLRERKILKTSQEERHPPHS